MTDTLLLLINADEQARQVVFETSKLMGTSSKVLELADAFQALSQPFSAGEVAILVLGSPENRQMLSEAPGEDGKPRWPVVLLGDSSGGDEGSLPPECWQPAVLAYAINSAIKHHQTQRRLHQTVGDLRSMERRIRHDLNSPLNAILGLTELIEDITAQPCPEIKEYTKLIFEAIDGMVKTLERVGGVVRASTVFEQFQPVSMQDALWSAGQRLQQQTVARGINLRMADDMPEVLGVSTWLETIWYSLLSNTLAHAGKTPNVEAGWDRQSGSLRFWVQDDGPGIPVEKQSELFCPFDSLHKHNRARGLGLSIVHRLVSLQGGRCGYESPAQGGARFFFTLPA